MGAAIPNSELRNLAAGCDLDGVGAVAAHPVPVQDGARLRERVGPGLPADLGYLARGMDKRLDPALVLPGVRTVIAAYVSYLGPLPGAATLPDGAGFIARFAWGPDYHMAMGARTARLAGLLRERHGARTVHYSDTGPVLEKAWAAAAGLGFVGKNTLLATPRHGSFVFLGVILTDLEVETVDAPGGPLAGCGSCRSCQDACPTGALDRPYELDPRRCLAHLTASSREPLPEGVVLAGNLYGCDLCQDACPWNRRAVRPDRPEFRPLPGLYQPALADVLAMDDEGFARVFGPTPVRRRGRVRVQEVARRLAGR